MSSRPPAGEVMRVLHERYRASMPGVVAELLVLAGQLGTDPLSAEAIKAVRQHAHRLHGTAGTYGYPDVSALAADLEDRSDRWTADAAADLDGRATFVAQFADSLRHAFTL